MIIKSLPYSSNEKNHKVVMKRITKTLSIRVATTASSFILAFANCNTALAQDFSRDDPEPGTNVSQKTIEDLTGITINSTNYKDYISVGNGGSGSTTDGSASHRVFVIYNTDAKKFLASGSFWGTHASLSDKPHLFWLQRRNETLKSHKMQPLRYPSCTEEDIDIKNSDFGSKFINQGCDNYYIGSREGTGRSYATYNSLKILKKDGNEKKNLLSDGLQEADPSSGKDPGDNAYTDVSVTESYSPNGKCFRIENALSDLDLQAGDQLVAEITLTRTQTTDQNLLSIGQDIVKWANKTYGNLHLYYKPTKQIEATYVIDGDGTHKYTSTTFEAGTTVTIKLDKTGLYVNGEALHEAGVLPFAYKYADHQAEENYSTIKAGEIIKFKYDEATASYTLDANGYLQIDESGEGKEYDVDHDCYVYADAPTDDNAKLFISRKVIKEDGSYSSTDKFLAFAYDPGVKLEGAIGIYTDRTVDSYADGKSPKERCLWTFVPTGAEGVYKLALTMKLNPDGSASDTEKTYYLSYNSAYVHGNSTASTPNRYYYHQLDENGQWKEIREFSDDYTSVDLSENQNDVGSNWKIVAIGSYSDLANYTQDQMLTPVDMTLLISDPSFSRNSGGLKSWKVKDGNLDSEETTYNTAKLRIGYEGVYKTKTTDTSYYHGKGYNFNPNNATNYYTGEVGNLFNSTHSQNMCATIQNGGYGKFYQLVPVYRKGWYILSCQGMSTVGAKLYVSDGTETYSYPLTEITQSDYDDLVSADASKTYWPLDQNMPMYNASVWMNDTHIQANKANIDKYKRQVAINVTSLESHPGLSQDYKELEIGIVVPQSESQNTRATSTTDFTAFNSFQLFYSGSEEETATPLILSEDFTNLDYLDGTVETYKEAELHLNRTFNAKQWNTLVLPVSLTKDQFTTAFGNDAKLVKLSGIEEKKLIFTDETVSEDKTTFLRANKPYLIWTSKAKGDYPKTYGVQLTNKASTQVQVPRNHFMIEGVTLATNNENKDGYDFASLTTNNWKYVVGGGENNSASDASGNSTVFYGTLCKTFENKTILDGRPTLNDGRSLYMKPGDNSNFYYRKAGSSYGLNGFRCWFAVKNGTAATANSKLAIEIKGVTDGTTDIDSINADNGTTPVSRYSDAVYSLSGQKVAEDGNVGNLPAGIYVINGKKFVVNK